MAIKHLSGNRLQGTNAERLALLASTTTTVDFSSDPLTSSSTEVSYNATTDKIDYDLQGSDTGGGRGTIDLGASVGASWVIDFDIHDTAVTSNHTARLCNFFGMSTNNVDMTSTTALAGTLGVSSDIDHENASRDRYELIASSTGNYQSTDYITNADTITNNNHWYIRMTKDGSADTFKVDFYTTSARTGSPSHTVTKSSVTFDDVRYFGVWDSGDTGGTNRQVGNISEIKFWNNTTTNIPDIEAGTIFEEYDTGNHYIWSGSAWNQMS